MKLVCDVCGMEFKIKSPNGIKMLMSHVKEHVNFVRFDDPMTGDIHIDVKIDGDIFGFGTERTPLPMDKGVLVVLVGPPGCGKSTLSEELNSKFGFQTVSSDAIRKELYGDESVQGDNTRIFEIAHERARNLLNYCNVTFDATSCNKNHRKAILEATEPSRKVGICAVFTDSLQDCINRNGKRDRKVPSEVVENMWWNMRRRGYEPSVDEGFDCLVDAKILTRDLDGILADISRP